MATTPAPSTRVASRSGASAAVLLVRLTVTLILLGAFALSWSQGWCH